MILNWILFLGYLGCLLSVPLNENIYIFTTQVTLGITFSIILDKRLNKDRKWKKHSNF